MKSDVHPHYQSKVACVVMCVTAFAILSHAKLSFTPLGDLPGGDYGSLAYGISGDGKFVVGVSGSPQGMEGYRWSNAEGMQGLGDFPSSQFLSEAIGVSGNGDVVVGYGNPTNDDAFAASPFRWTINQGLLPLTDTSQDGAAIAVNGDGTVVVGSTLSGAFLWTSNDGLQLLGAFNDGNGNSEATGVSADGTIVTGWSNRLGSQEAFRWDAINGLVGIGDLPGGRFDSSARDISADGQVIVGESSSTAGSVAFRWTNELGMISLGDLSNGVAPVVESYANGTNEDGSVIVGESVEGGAFVWDTYNGMRSLTELLEAEGLDLSDWDLIEAVDVSDDGSVIVGSARNPDGNFEAYIVTGYNIPEPRSFALIFGAIGLFSVLVIKCRLGS